MVRNIALLTGGDSSEWQIALQGAENIGNALDRSRYTPYTIVLRNGHWTYTAPDGTKSELDRNDFTLPVAGRKIKLDYRKWHDHHPQVGAPAKTAGCKAIST